MTNKKKSAVFVDAVSAHLAMDSEDLRLLLSSKVEIYTSMWVFGMGIVLTLALALNAFPNDPLTLVGKFGLVIVIVALYGVFRRSGDPEERLERILNESDYFEAKEIIRKRMGSPSESNSEKMTPLEIKPSEDPKFDKDVELAKINLLSEEVRNRFFTAIGAYFAVLIAMLAAAFEVSIRFGVGESVPWIFVIGLLIVFPIVTWIARKSIKRYKLLFLRFQPLIKNIEDGKTNGTLDEMLTALYVS